MPDVRACPLCSASLDPFLHEGVTLDRCPAGHGLWLDRGELRAVVDAEEADRPEAEERAALEAAARDAGHAVLAEVGRERRSCPICGVAMRIVEYANSGVAVDTCQEHGTWLDAGELERIEAYAEGFRRPPGGGPAQDVPRVLGLAVPPELLATITSASVPRPDSSPN